MEPFDYEVSDRFEKIKYKPYKKYIQENYAKVAVAALVTILVCIVGYLLTSVHHLQSQLQYNEALTLNADDLTTMVKKLDDDFQELSRLFDLHGPAITDAETGTNELKTKFENMKGNLNNLETNLENTLIDYAEPANGTIPRIQVDRVLDSSYGRRINAFDSALQEVQTLTQQNSDVLQNDPKNNDINIKDNPLINDELLNLEDDIKKLKHLVVGTDYSLQLKFF